TPPSSVHHATQKWFVVMQGHDVGVYQGWHVASPLVSGVSGACYKKYSTENDAWAAFKQALDHGTIVIV
ncbi:hypothetical protein L208DRAFT_1279478, partial [Tricholoma matsutake]